MQVIFILSNMLETISLTAGTKSLHTVILDPFLFLWAGIEEIQIIFLFVGFLSPTFGFGAGSGLSLKETNLLYSEEFV